MIVVNLYIVLNFHNMSHYCHNMISHANFVFAQTQAGVLTIIRKLPPLPSVCTVYSHISSALKCQVFKKNGVGLVLWTKVAVRLSHTAPPPKQLHRKTRDLPNDSLTGRCAFTINMLVPATLISSKTTPRLLLSTP